MNYFLLYYHIILNEKNEDFQKKNKITVLSFKKAKTMITPQFYFITFS